MTIILDHISKSYNGREVLKDFYLEVEDKRIYQIVGPEGSVWHVKKAHRKVSGERAKEELLRFLPEERIIIPVSELSDAEI